MDRPVNIWDYERLAEEKLDANAHAYFAGGSGDEVTLRDNLAAFERRKLRPRVLVDVSSVSTATTVLGTEVALPVLIAPLALQRMAHPDGELGTARAAAAAGTVMCLSTAATARPAEVAAAAPDAPRWFQVYVFGDRSQTEDLIAEAIEHRLQRARADRRRSLSRSPRARHSHRLQAARASHRLRRHLRPRSSMRRLSWRDLEWLSGYGLPLVVKGLLTAEDARLAVRARRGGRRRLEPRRPPARRGVRDPRRARGSRRRRRRACGGATRRRRSPRHRRAQGARSRSPRAS